MSTISLLDPNVRNARVRRGTAVRELRGMVRMYAEGSKERFRVESLAATLNDVHRDPRFTGAQKDQKFRALLNRAR